MNWEAWKPLAVLIFTTVLKWAGGFLMAHGLVTTGASYEMFAGAATTAAGAWWSWWVQKGHTVAGDWLKQITQTATAAAAVEVAKRMQATPAMNATVDNAKASAVIASPAVMAKDAAKAA